MKNPSKAVFENWCDTEKQDVAGKGLHVLREKQGSRALALKQLGSLDGTVAAHYDDPKRLADRLARIGYAKTAQLLIELLPRSPKARSGHLGEILATEAVPAVLRRFRLPINRLRWLDGREMSLRGEDLIGIADDKKPVRFLKGESKSRAKMTPSVLAQARIALDNNHGRPSQHAMSFVMNRLLEAGEEKLALIFEEFLLKKTIPLGQLVHVTFAFTGNDAIAHLKADLLASRSDVEQHAITLQLADHQAFIKSIYDTLEDAGNH